jgi:hypothetical protein
MTNKDLFTLAYDSLFKSIQENEINVFLCGKSVDEEESIRSELQKFLDNHPRINVIYPEWLFSNILEKKGNDLLSLENVLASDVDKIILPLEGPGSFCELGSFVMRDEIVNKLIILNKKEFEHKPSFVNKGPLRLIKKSKSGSIFIMDEENKADIVKSIESKIIFGKYDRSKRNIVNIFSLATFLGILIGLYQPIRRKYLENEIKQWNADIDIHMIDPTLELLINKKILISKPIEKGDEVLELTANGYNHYYDNILLYRTKQRVFTKLRATALWTKRKSYNKFDYLGRARLLEQQQ